MFIIAAGWQPRASWLIFFWGTPGPTLVCITECARYTRYIAFGLWFCAIWTVNKTQKKERLNTCDDSIDLHVAHTEAEAGPIEPGSLVTSTTSAGVAATALEGSDGARVEGLLVWGIMLLSDLVIVDVGVRRYCWWWRWGIFSLKAERLANWIWNEVSLDVLDVL